MMLAARTEHPDRLIDIFRAATDLPNATVLVEATDSMIEVVAYAPGVIVSGWVEATVEDGARPFSFVLSSKTITSLVSRRGATEAFVELDTDEQEVDIAFKRHDGRFRHRLIDAVRLDFAEDDHKAIAQLQHLNEATADAGSYPPAHILKQAVSLLADGAHIAIGTIKTEQMMVLVQGNEEGDSFGLSVYSSIR